jgi:hypothetical protein
MTFFVFSVFPAPDSPLWSVSLDQFQKELGNLRHEDTLVLAFFDKIAEGLVSHRENVRLCVLSTPSSVHVDIFACIDG